MNWKGKLAKLLIGFCLLTSLALAGHDVDEHSANGSRHDVIVDIKNWQHPTKKVFESYGFKVIKVDLEKNKTFPIFYVIPGGTTVYDRALVNRVAKNNGFWDFRIVDVKNNYFIEAYCSKKEKKVIKTISDEDGENTLFPIKQSGYIDKDGYVIVEPQYDLAFPLVDGRGLVFLDKKYGFIDASGKLVIDLQFDYAWDFSEGLAAVMINNRYGYINRHGVMVIEPKFEQASPFSEGLAKVSLPGESINYIDATGNIVLKTGYYQAGDFHDDRASVQIGFTYGYIDRQGNLVIPPKTPGLTKDLPIYGFSEGYGIMKIEQGDYSDTEDSATEDDLIIEQTFLYVYVNKWGEVLGDMLFYDANSFSEGLAAVYGDQGKGFIDKTGKLVIECRYVGEGFSEGLAGVVKDDKIGFIDKKGNMVIKPAYESIWQPFSHGLAYVWDGKRLVYIDKTGREVWAGRKRR